MKHFRTLLFFTLLFITLPATAKDAVHVGILNGPSSIPASYLIEKHPVADATYHFVPFASPQALLPKMLKGEVDIGFFPPNVAAKAYNSSNGSILCAGVSETGCLFLLTKDSRLSSLEDLRDRTVHSAGYGATPEYLVQWMLSKHNIPVNARNGVYLDYSMSKPQELVAQLISGKIDYTIVPEPFATVARMKAGKSLYVLDLQRVYAMTLDDGKATYPITVMAVRKEFAQKHPEALRAFIKDFEKAITWTNKHPNQAGVFVGKHISGISAEVASQAIPTCGFVWQDAESSRENLEKNLQLFLDFSPESIGGKLPDADFYFK